MLVEWGIKIADELGIPAYLESSPMAHSLYQKYGFKDVHIFTMGPQFTIPPNADPRIWFMLRDVPAKP